MDFLQKRIREKLIQRGNSERQRAEEWERSLKPTTYLGKNLYQELGGTPIEGRYLGQQGLIPGQSVPNIGRNPNKPVIPGLPQIVIPEPEEEVFLPQKIWFSQNYETSLTANRGAALATVLERDDPVLDNINPITGNGSLDSSYTGGLLVQPTKSFGDFVKTKAFSIEFKFRTLNDEAPNPLLSTNPGNFNAVGAIDFLLEYYYVPSVDEILLGLGVFIRTDTVIQFISTNLLPQNLNDGIVHTVELTRRNGVYTFSIDGVSATQTIDNFDYSRRTVFFDDWGILLAARNYGFATIDDVLIKLL
jgi:hypothetical protein